MNRVLLILLTLVITHNADAQKKHVFYLHGAIVQQMGAEAFSTQYGKYEYTAIVDTLKGRDYEVISEIRPKNMSADVYAEKVTGQVKELLAQGVAAKDITIIGASAGAHIAVDVAIAMQDTALNFALLGICREGIATDFIGKKICGRFFSIYEKTDFALSCVPLLKARPCITSFKELELNTGYGHGFLYKPYGFWMNPVMEWINKKR